MTEIVLTTEWMDRLKARAVPGAYWSAEDRSWRLGDPSPRAAAVALKMFPALAGTNPELLELRSSLTADIRPIDNATEFAHPIGAHRVRDILEAEGKSFFDYQATDLGYLSAVLEQHGGAYNGWEMGLGKTLGACALIDELDCQRSLIICPNTAKFSVWQAELEHWCPWLTTLVLRNTKAHRKADIATLRQLDAIGFPVAFVVHYDALKILAVECGSKSVNGWDKLGTWDITIADEIHRIANPKTQTARSMQKIKAPRKLGMSGSIIQNHAEELYSPLHWLYPERYKSKWRDWNGRYLDYVENGYSKVCIGVKEDKIQDMRNELGVFMVVRRKEDELDLPGKTEITRYVELSPSQRKAYNELRDQSYTVLENDQVLVAIDGLSILTRLRQIATGLDSFGTAISDSTKLDTALEMIEDNEDEAFVVFSWYKAAAHAMAERLESKGIQSYLVTGDTSQVIRASSVDEFQKGGRRVFIGTIATTGEAITLHRASNAIFLDRHFNPEKNRQAADRIYRIGQERPVTITYLVAKDTVDELVVTPILTDKTQLRTAILGG